MDTQGKQGVPGNIPLFVPFENGMPSLLVAESLENGLFAPLFPSERKLRKVLARMKVKFDRIVRLERVAQAGLYIPKDFNGHPVWLAYDPHYVSGRIQMIRLTRENEDDYTLDVIWTKPETTPLELAEMKETIADALLPRRRWRL